MTTPWKDQPLSVVVFAIQLVLLAVYNFGDIGFDHPGRFGMSWWHGIAILFLYFLALLVGIPVALVEKKRRLAIAQAVIPMVLVAWNFMGLLF